MGRPKGGKNKEWPKEEEFKIIEAIINHEKSSKEVIKELKISNGMLWPWINIMKVVLKLYKTIVNQVIQYLNILVVKN